MTALRLLVPRGIGQVIAVVLMSIFAFYGFTSMMIGDFDLQRLQSQGQDGRAQIQRVLESEGGVPTKVLIDGTTAGRPIELTDLEGSIVGNEVEVRYVLGELTWSQTKYRSATLLKPALIAIGGPLALAFVPIFLINLREHRRPVSDFSWAQRGPATARPPDPWVAPSPDPGSDPPAGAPDVQP